MYTLTYDAKGKLTAVSRYDEMPANGLAAGEYEATEAQFNNPLAWVPSGSKLAPNPNAASVLLTNAVNSALRQIDVDVDKIYGDIIGNRQAEYDRAEQEAQAYKDAAYPATPVPSSVQGYADAKKWTAKAAADDILATASAWRNSQADIRNTRLAKKEAARNAADVPGVETVITAWADYVKQTRTALGI